MAKVPVPTTGTVIASTWGKSVADHINARYIQSNSVAQLTNATGDIGISFPVAFSGVPAVLLQPIGQNTGYMSQVLGPTANGFTARFFTGTAAPAANTTVNFIWVAIGVEV